MTSLSFSYDPFLDILTVEGKRYSGELFRKGLTETPEGMCFRLVKDGDTFITHTQEHGLRPPEDKIS